jgi:acyl-CoA thioesterase-1
MKSLKGLLLVALVACSTSAARAATIVVLGDSISAGYGIPPERGWVQLLAARVAADGHAVVNASLSGETTGGGLSRLPGLLERHRPDVVVIELGGNDGLRGYPVARIRANLAELVRRARAAGARVVVAGMQIPPNYGERYVTAFHAVFADVVGGADAGGAGVGDGDGDVGDGDVGDAVGLVPFLLDGVALEPGLMQPDGIHPTAEAQPRLLESAWPAIRDALDALPAAATGGAGG